MVCVHRIRESFLHQIITFLLNVAVSNPHVSYVAELTKGVSGVLQKLIKQSIYVVWLEHEQIGWNSQRRQNMTKDWINIHKTYEVFFETHIQPSNSRRNMNDIPTRELKIVVPKFLIILRTTLRLRHSHGLDDQNKIFRKYFWSN